MNHKKQVYKVLLAMLLTAMLLIVAACGNKGEVNNTAPNKAANENNAAGGSESAAEYPFTIKDDTGTEVTFAEAPAKVVTLVPSETEIMFAIGAGDQVVGVDEYSNYPEEAASKQKVGDMTTNIEAVAALEPDLVLASASMNTDAIAQLRELDIPVFASEPTTYDATVAKIELIGKIMNKGTEAGQVAEHMRTVKQQVTDAVKDAQAKSVYLEFSPGWTVGSGTFLDELLTLAGGTNIAGSQAGWYEVSAEEVVKQNPNVIIYPDLQADPNPILAAIESRPGWEVIDAISNKQLFAVAEDPLVRVGPRLADGLLELAQKIHPDLVK